MQFRGNHKTLEKEFKELKKGVGIDSSSEGFLDLKTPIVSILFFL